MVPGQLDYPPGTARVRGQAGLAFFGFCHEILAMGTQWQVMLPTVGSVTSAVSGPGLGWALAVFLCIALPTWPGVTGSRGLLSRLLGTWCESMEAGTQCWGKAVLLLALPAGVSSPQSTEH